MPGMRRWSMRDGHTGLIPDSFRTHSGLIPDSLARYCEVMLARFGRAPSRGVLVLIPLAILLMIACSAAPAARVLASPAAQMPTVVPATAVASVAPVIPAPTVAAAPAIRGELIIFAAASLTDAFNQIGAALEQANPGAKLTFNFAGSSALRTQLSQGAPADVFASADQANMQGAQKDGSISGDARVFAQNRLVIITPAQRKIDVSTPRDLVEPGLKLVIGQQALPAGNYARQIFTKMSQDATYGSDFSTKVLANVVSEESSVRQIVSKVQLGEADAGIVYSTDVTPSLRSQVKIVDIPAAFNVIAQYPVALVMGGKNADSAEAFIDYLVSPSGQAILEKNGFIRADAKP